MTHSSLPLSRLSPLRARLLNALISRALPVEFGADAGAGNDAPCRLDLNDRAAALDSSAPFASAATLFAVSGDAWWKLELSSLEALALRSELAEWRQSHDSDFSALPEALTLAVLERLFEPALDKLARWLGCEAHFSPGPAAHIDWSPALPFTLTLPRDGKIVYARLFWSDDQAARFVLERLEALPPRTRTAMGKALPDAVLSCPVEIGAMSLSVEEGAALAPGDILLPERWTPETPRLMVPGLAGFACALEKGILSVLGRDAAQPLIQSGMQKDEASESHEVVMTDPNAPSSSSLDERSENSPGAPLVRREELDALELPVSFELATLTLRVDEVAALAPGFTFALSGDASSVPILVRVGGRALARGRLVDVGGVPGVQISSMTQPEEEKHGTDAQAQEN